MTLVVGDVPELAEAPGPPRETDVCMVCHLYQWRFATHEQHVICVLNFEQGTTRDSPVQEVESVAYSSAFGCTGCSSDIVANIRALPWLVNL